jgi:hypothetical protein
LKIHHSGPRRAFAAIPNDTLRDERLSLAARGELAYLLSLPDGWNTTADAEAKRARSLRGKRGEGRDAMRRIYAELKDTGYIRYVRTQDKGMCSTVIHVFDRPSTDARLTDTPETRMSVPPAEMPEPVDNPADTFSQVAPMYGSPGVGTPAVGTPVHRQAVHSYEDGTTEDGEGESPVGDGVDDWGVRGNHPRHEDDDQGQEPAALRLPQVANSQKTASSRLNDQPVADEAQEIPFHDAESATDGSCARASESAPPPRKCDYAECATPEKPLRDDERQHIGCGLIIRRAERAQAEAVTQ